MTNPALLEVLLGCPSGTNPAPFPAWRRVRGHHCQILLCFLVLPLLPTAALALILLGLGWMRLGSCVGREGIFLVPHQAWGYPNLLLCVSGGWAAEYSQFGGLPQKPLVCPPEPHPCIQPFPSLLPRRTWSLSQPLCAPQRTFLAGVKGAGGDRAATQSLCRLRGQPGSSCSILVVMKSIGKSSP